jgi:hypothetical protein
MKIFSIAASAMVCFLSLWATPSSAYEPATIYNHSLNEGKVFIKYSGCKGDKWRIPPGKIENGMIVPSVSYALTRRGNCLITRISVDLSPKSKVSVDSFKSSGTSYSKFHILQLKSGKDHGKDLLGRPYSYRVFIEDGLKCGKKDERTYCKYVGAPTPAKCPEYKGPWKPCMGMRHPSRPCMKTNSCGVDKRSAEEKKENPYDIR